MPISESGLYEPTPEERQAFSKYTLCILTPAADYKTYCKFAKCLADLVAYSWMHGLKIVKAGVKERMVVHWARNDLAEQAMRIGNPYTGEPYTHFLWLDDDMVFGPDLAVYLAKNGHLDAVSGLYYGRTQHLPVCYHKDPNEKEEMKHQPWVKIGPKLFEVDAIGFGCVLIRREVFEKTPFPWFQFEGGGEDLYFCVKAKKHGFKIWCDGSYTCGHIGDPQIISHAAHKQYLKDHESDFESGLTRVEL